MSDAIKIAYGTHFEIGVPTNTNDSLFQNLDATRSPATGILCSNHQHTNTSLFYSIISRLSAQKEEQVKVSP